MFSNRGRTCSRRCRSSRGSSFVITTVSVPFTAAITGNRFYGEESWVVDPAGVRNLITWPRINDFTPTKSIEPPTKKIEAFTTADL